MSDLETLSFGCEEEGDLWLEFLLGPGGPAGVPHPPEPCWSRLPPSGRTGPAPPCGPIPAVAETAAAAMAAADTICGCDGALASGELDPSKSGPYPETGRPICIKLLSIETERPTWLLLYMFSGPLEADGAAGIG